MSTSLIAPTVSIVGAIASYICFYLHQRDKRPIITPNIFLERRKSGKEDLLLEIINSGERTAETIYIELKFNLVERQEDSMVLIESKELYKNALSGIAPKEAYCVRQLAVRSSYKEPRSYLTLTAQYSDSFGKGKRTYNRTIHYKIGENSITACSDPKTYLPTGMKIQRK